MEKYLRIMIIRELVTSFSQRDALEKWGKARIEYFGLNEKNEKIQDLAIKYHIRVDELVSGIAQMLDVFRRTRMFYDELTRSSPTGGIRGTRRYSAGSCHLWTFPPKGLKMCARAGAI